MPPDPAALPPTWTPGHYRGCPKEWEPSGTCTCTGGDLTRPGLPTFPASPEILAQLRRIAAKVDAGEPVSVEPGGYRALTEEQLARLTLSWPWSDGDDPAERLAQRYGAPAVAKKLSLRPPTLSEPESKWVGCFEVIDGLEFARDWQAGDPDPGFGRPPDIPDSWRWTALGLVVAALAVWRWRR